MLILKNRKFRRILHSLLDFAFISATAKAINPGGTDCKIKACFVITGPGVLLKIGAHHESC